MKSKVHAIIDGELKEFADIQEVIAYAKECGITGIEVVNLDTQSLKREVPDVSIRNYEMFEPRIPVVISKSGQENRRARRAAERAKKKGSKSP